LRKALDALSADAGSTNEARRTRAVARRTQHLRADEARTKRLQRSVRKHVLAKHAEVVLDARRLVEIAVLRGRKAVGLLEDAGEPAALGVAEVVEIALCAA
jgi:hypothetical protein